MDTQSDKTNSKRIRILFFSLEIYFSKSDLSSGVFYSVVFLYYGIFKREY